MLSRLLCYCLIWPLLLWKFAPPSPRPAPHVYRRQVAAVAQVGPRVVAVRLQVVLA
jgi:hypothetical protein